MLYEIWTFQEHIPDPVVTSDGKPVFPGSLPPRATPPSVVSPKVVCNSVQAAVSEVMTTYLNHGVSGGDMTEIIPKVYDALSGQGAYRSALPVKGKWVLAQRVKDVPFPGRTRN